MDRNFVKEGGPEKHDSAERIDSIWKIWEILQTKMLVRFSPHFAQIRLPKNPFKNKFPHSYRLMAGFIYIYIYIFLLYTAPDLLPMMAS